MRLLFFLSVFPLCGFGQELNVGLGAYYYQQQFVSQQSTDFYKKPEDIPSHYSGYSSNLEMAIRDKLLYFSASYYRYDLHFYLKGYYSNSYSGLGGSSFSSYTIDYDTRISFNAFLVTLGFDPLKEKFRLIPCLAMGQEFKDRETAKSDQSFYNSSTTMYNPTGGMFTGPTSHSSKGIVPGSRFVEMDNSIPLTVFIPQIKLRYAFTHYLNAGVDIGARFADRVWLRFRRKETGISYFTGIQVAYRLHLKKQRITSN